MSSRKVIFFLGKLLVSCGLLSFIYRKTPLADIQDVLLHSNLALLAAVYLIFIVNTVLSSLKWKIFLTADNIDIPLPKLVVSYLIGGFFNVFLPSNIGGDSYRIYDIAQKSSEGVRSAISVFADRLTGFFALVCLSLVSSVIVAGFLHNYRFILLPLLVFAALSVMVYMLWSQRPVRQLLAFTRLDRFRFVDKVSTRLLDTFARYRSHPGIVVRVMSISFVFQLLLIIAVYIMAHALGSSAVPFVFFSAFVPLITLMEAVPVSVYGVGIRDMGYVYFFGIAGMPEAYTRSLALLFLLMTLSYALVGGVLFVCRICSVR